VKEFIKSLIYGPNGPSLTSTMAVVAFLLFILVTLYLVLTAKTWAHYEVFAGVTCGGGLITQATGKFINTKAGCGWR
jgi:hypothetical protein